MPIIPQKLKQGDMIRVIAPSHSLGLIVQEIRDIAIVASSICASCRSRGMGRCRYGIESKNNLYSYKHAD